MRLPRRRIIGIDPGSNATGWGVIDVEGSRFVHVAHGTVRLKSRTALESRLVGIYDTIERVITDHGPTDAAAELPFVADNAQTAIVLGHARAAMLAGGLSRVMIVAKGSLFLGRMTQLADGMSFILENPVRNQ